MAIYKVPQDVEAEDRLLGPFTFRQFIYLIVVAVLGFFAFALWQLLPILAVIPVPIMLLFAALALPLRKDQPMETYLSAVISYYIKPRVRLWDPDGVETRVEITAPKVTEYSLIKNLSNDEAERRFAYLAQIVDSKGWATRSTVATTDIQSNLNPEIYYEAADTVDILDENYSVGQIIDQRLEQNSTRYRQNIINSLSHPAETTPTVQPVDQSFNQPIISNTQPIDQQIYPEAPATYTHPIMDTPILQTEQQPVGNIVINPYPTINQAVIMPSGSPQMPPPEKPSKNELVKDTENNVSAGIIELATNAPEDFSIATLASQAKRISREEKELDKDEVIISLR